MTGIAHLSTGLYLKARFPKAPLLWLFLAAEASDLIWVALNLLHPQGEVPLEVARARQPFRSIGDLKLVEQPFSHSLLANLVLAVFLGCLAYAACRKARLAVGAVAVPVFLAVFGHWLLDFLVHDGDMTLTPWSGSMVLGPAFGLDAAVPLHGLSSTAPLLSFLLQTGVVLLCGATFIGANPSSPARRRWLAVVLLALSLAAAPMFVRGMATRMMSSTPALILGTLGEIVVLTAVLYLLVTRYTHPGLRPVYGPYSPELVELLGGYKGAASVMAFTLAGVYLLSAGLDAQRHPQVGMASTVLALGYLGLGGGLAGRNLSAWWPAVFMPLLVGPMVRLCVGTGRLGLLAAGLEILLAVLSLYAVLKMRTSKILL